MKDSSKSPVGLVECPGCGASVDPSRAQGLCPACAWAFFSGRGDGDYPASQGLSSKALFQFANHLVFEEISRGGMGIVYRAQQLRPSRTVALKMLLPHQLGSTQMRQRFGLEIKAIVALEHSAILPVYEIGEQDGMPYFTMKLAAGGTLATRVERYQGRFREIAELMASMAEAVHFAHERGILHRDIKPGNILFDDADRPYVSDFGLAKFSQAEGDGTPAITQSIQLLGTPQFLPPEVASGGVGCATTAGDIYSLGAVLYELLTGQAPFRAPTLPALLKCVIEQSPVRPARLMSSVPRDLEVICLKCLAKNPADRYGSARELAEDLRRWLTGRPILARPISLTAWLRHWTRRNPALTAVSLLLAGAVVVGGILQFRANADLRLAVKQTQRALQASLVAQAGLKRASSGLGQRFDTIELVGRAIAMGTDSTPEFQLRARTEISGALALPDLKTLSRWPIYVGHFEGAASFSRDLSKYVCASPQGGIAVYTTDNRRLLGAFPGKPKDPAILFKFSPDGTYVGASFQDGHAEIHSLIDPKTGYAFAGVPQLLTAIDFVPGHPHALVASLSEGLYVFDLLTGNRRTLQPAPVPCLALSVDPSGRRVAMMNQNQLEIIRLTDGAKIWAKELSAGATWIDWSSDGARLATAGGEPRFETQVFDAQTGQTLRTYKDDVVAIGRVAFHPDGQSVLSTSWDGRLAWHELAEDGFRFIGEGGPRLLQFSEDGVRLAYEPAHGELGIYEAATPAIFRNWADAGGADEESFMMVLSPDGKLAATASARGVHLWDTSLRKAIGSIQLPLRMWFVTVLFEPHGKSLLYSGVGLGIHEVELIQTGSSEPGAPRIQLGANRQLGDSTESLALEFAPDGRSLIVGENKQNVKNERRSPDIWLWPDAEPSRRRLLASDWPLVGYHMTKDGNWGLTAHSTEPDITVWDPATGRRLKGLGISEPVSFELAPNGRWLLASTKEEYHLIEIGSWRSLAHWPARFGQQHYRCFAFAPDSSMVATVAQNGRVDLRSLPEGAELIDLPSPKTTQIKSLQFSPDSGRLLMLTGAGGMQEWKLDDLRRQLSALGLDWKTSRSEK